MASPIRVAFLTFYYEAWDALADVHAQMLADERFDVRVISIPRRFRKEEPFGGETQVSEFLNSLGVVHDRFNFEDSFEGLSQLRDWAPDYVFINYPWQRNYQPGYRVEELAQFTKVCYVPYYSLALVNEPGAVGITPYLYTQRSNQLASLVFTQDQATVDAYATTSRGNAYVHLTGTPKLDSLVRQVQDGVGRWPLENPGNLRIVWAPHHSFSDSWLNFGMFPEVFEDFLTFAKDNPSVDIVMRPHPIMFGTLVSQGLIAEERLDAWKVEWKALPNTWIDDAGEIPNLFAASDLLVTDGISFLGEYPLATGKPAIYFDKAGHWPWSPIGELASRANVHVSNFDEFLNFFEAYLGKGLPDLAGEIATLRRAAQPFPGEAATKIVQVVVEDYEARTPLVNKESVTEVPWERLPGAEAPWD